MKIKRPSEKHFSDGLFTVKPFTGLEQQIRCGKTVSQRAFGVKADEYSAVCTAGRSREGQAARQGSGMNGLFGRGRLKNIFQAAPVYPSFPYRRKSRPQPETSDFRLRKNDGQQVHSLYI